MGEAARRAFIRRTTPGERLAYGLELAEIAVRSRLRRAGIDPDTTDPEELQKAFWVLREAE